jgi:nicotinate-nucleotide adenylyltransferase
MSGRGGDISKMVCAPVAEYITKNQLWTPAGRIVRLTSLIEAGNESATLYIERGKCYFQFNEWGKAINDFNKAMTIEPENKEAKQLHDMVYEILSFRYKDIYNP